MERRELLKLIAVTTGTAMVGMPALAYDQVPPVPLKDTPFSKEDVSFINDVAEVILPKTDTPGAKDANVGATIAVIATDCYTDAQRENFKAGLKDIDTRAQSQFGKPFLLLDSDSKTTLLSELDREANAYNKEVGLRDVATDKPSDREPGTDKPLPHAFSLVKQMSLYTFFTSEVGATKVLRYVAVPGYYNGELEYKKGDKAWAT